MRNIMFATLLTASLAGTAMAKSDEGEKAVGAVLDQFHQAAAKADAPAYFGLFAPEGVFIGTDATERWDVAAFKKYAEPHFSKGKGWTYTMKSRHVEVAPEGTIAWFDEILDNQTLGLCRGSGVLRKIGKDWKVAQYHLTIPVPNDLAKKVVELIAKPVKTK